MVLKPLPLLGITGIPLRSKTEREWWVSSQLLFSDGPEVEGVFRQALELGQPDRGQAPEAIDAVDMDGAFGELVAGMVDADVAIAEVDQAVVAAPAIGVDDGARVDPAADDGPGGWASSSPGRSRAKNTTPEIAGVRSPRNC